jgi:hypothetical protein
MVIKPLDEVEDSPGWAIVLRLTVVLIAFAGVAFILLKFAP